MATIASPKPRMAPSVAKPPSAAAQAPLLRLRECTPEELAIQAQAGSQEAFSQLVHLFQDRLYNFLLRRLSPPDAEDLTQETFIRAWLRIQQYRPRWRFSTWLFTIATRLATSHSRRLRPASSLSIPGLDEAAMAPQRAAEPALNLIRGEARAAIWLLVDEVLTPEQRTAVWLHYVEDIPMPEIATVMGKSRIAVRVMLHRSRSALAERLEHNGGAPHASTAGIQP
jgi:RNA polymerase sigma-70 factor, ECF subfamily